MKLYVSFIYEILCNLELQAVVFGTMSVSAEKTFSSEFYTTFPKLRSKDALAERKASSFPGITKLSIAAKSASGMIFLTVATTLCTFIR